MVHPHVGSTPSREFVSVLLLVLISCCAYLNSLDGTFVFDDSRIFDNPALRLESFTLGGLVRAVRGMEPASRPVANLTFILNSLAHGLEVRGYHLVNLTIHILNGLVLYLLLKTIFAQAVLAGSRPAEGVTLASTLLWLVHPLNTQAVSYIVQRMTSLASLLVVLSLLLYARGRNRIDPYRRVLLLAGSVLSWLLALGSKEIAVTLPLFILLYEWYFVRDLRRDWLASNKTYLVVVGIVLSAAPFFFMGAAPWSVIAEGYAGRDFSLGQRVLTESRVLLFYLSLFILPLPGRLSVEHDFSPSLSLLTPPTTLLAAAAILALLAMALGMAKKYRFESFCILWFFGNHLLEGTVLPLELVFEHRNYLPTMLLAPLAIVCLGRWLTNRVAATAILGAVLALFTFWTHQRNVVWQSELSLWQDSVEKAPHSARAHNNLATALLGNGNLAEAMAQYQESIRLDPGYAAAHYNLGSTLMLSGNGGQAIISYRQAVLLRPGDAEMRMGLADALLQRGRYAEARSEYQQVVRLDPDNRDAARKLEGIRWQEKPRQRAQQP